MAVEIGTFSFLLIPNSRLILLLVLPSKLTILSLLIQLNKQLFLSVSLGLIILQSPIV